MPAGNDAVAAAQELAARYPEASDASVLIEANRRRRPRELVAALRAEVNEEATEALDLNEVAKRAKVDEVVDAAVRGNKIVFVYRDAKGRLHKAMIGRGKSSSSSSGKRSRRSSAKSTPAKSTKAKG